MSKPHLIGPTATSTAVRVIDAAPPRIGAEAYSAASRTHPDLRRWTPMAGSADADLLPERDTIVARSRDLERNHGVAGGALQTVTDNVIGTGLRLCADPDYRLLGRDKAWAEEWSNNVEALWRTWAGTTACDATACLTFDGLTTQVYRSGWLNGEGLALPLWVPDARPHRGRFATRLQVIEPDRLSNPDDAPDTDKLRGGIELGRFGEPIAAHIRKTHPGDRFVFFGGWKGEWERIPWVSAWGRPRVLHVHDRERSGQTRGKPALTAVMRQFKVLGDFTNAELKAAVVNAMVALVTESAVGEEALVELLSGNSEALKNYQDGLTNRNRSAIDFNAGMVIPLALGEKIAGFTPARPAQSFEAFTTSIFRLISSGLNLPYELLLKDFSKTNYSSARAALMEAWRFFRGRRQWISIYWASPAYGLFLEEAVNAGLVEAPDFYVNQAAYARARWIGPGRGWIDPQKEAQAAETRIRIGISTLEAECAEQGLDWEEVLEQRAAEVARLKALGLDFLVPTVAAAPIVGAPGAEAPPEEDDPEAEAEREAEREDRAETRQAIRTLTEIAKAPPPPPAPVNVTVAPPAVTVNVVRGKVKTTPVRDPDTQLVLETIEEPLED